MKLSKAQLRKLILREIADMSAMEPGAPKGQITVEINPSPDPRHGSAVGSYMAYGMIDGNMLRMSTQQDYGASLMDVSQWSYNPEGALKSAIEKHTGRPMPRGYLDGVKIDVIENPRAEPGYVRY